MLAAERHHDGQGSDTPCRLAADIGGTYARVALLQFQSHSARPVTVERYMCYRCTEWGAIDDMLLDYLQQHARDRHVREVVLAAAGYADGDALVAENLPWPVRLNHVRDRLGLAQLTLVNDFEALAHAVPFLTASAGHSVVDAAAEDGPCLVVGPGTGLGCALLLPGEPYPQVLPSEAGHVAWAPGSERECQLMRRLGQGRTYVHTGHVLSGPGLVNLYRAIADTDGRGPVHERPEQVSAAALQGDDAPAREALELFCAMLGGLVGDLAVLFKASGGVWLAGGILPHIEEFLLRSGFRERFFNKGVMRTFLEKVPVRLIEHGQLGVIGAGVLLAQRQGWK